MGTYSITHKICPRFGFCNALLWLDEGPFYPYLFGLVHRYCGNLTIAPVPVKPSKIIWMNIWFEFTIDDYITTAKQCKTQQCAYFMGYTVAGHFRLIAKSSELLGIHSELAHYKTRNHVTYTWVNIG